MKNIKGQIEKDMKEKEILVNYITHALNNEDGSRCGREYFFFPSTDMGNVVKEIISRADFYYTAIGTEVEKGDYGRIGYSGWDFFSHNDLWQQEVSYHYESLSEALDAYLL